MGNLLEEYIANGFLTIVGDPMYIGFLVLAFFAGFVLLQNVNTTQKIAILVPAGILAAAFIPFFLVFVALISAALVYLGIMRLTNK
jgi:predicted branched-subunit amino acid permease